MPQVDELLAPAEQQALTRLAEAAISASAEVLSDLVLHTVRVDAPELSTGSWTEIQERFRGPMLVVRVEYVSGVVGSNLLLMEAEDARAIAAMMMAEELTDAVQLDELHLSALAEAMNQMMGTSATALSNLLQRRIEMTPPVTRLRRVAGDEEQGPLLIDDGEGGALVVLSFPMRIDDEQMGTVQSRVLQVFPVGFARRLAGDYLQASAAAAGSSPARSAEKKAVAAAAGRGEPTASRAATSGPPVAAGSGPARAARVATAGTGAAGRKAGGEALEAERWGPAPLLDEEAAEEAEDRISMAVIKRITVPVTVRLGQAYLPLQDVLSLTRGSVVALDVAEGQPVDVLASGTLVARGEVVVVREHFGVRITELVRPESS